MKQIMCSLMLLGVSISLTGKDLKTIVFTTSPKMHCESCETKIKGNLRFEKGVKSIETNIDRQEVNVKYDAEKTTPAKIAAGFRKFGYTARELKPGETAEKDQTAEQKAK